MKDPLLSKPLVSSSAGFKPLVSRQSLATHTGTSGIPAPGSILLLGVTSTPEGTGHWKQLAPRGIRATLGCSEEENMSVRDCMDNPSSDYSLHRRNHLKASLVHACTVMVQERKTKS